jgi:hypothetical protein
MLDAIGMAHMTQGDSTSFTSDRFGNPNSALALNGGWTRVPSGIYFNTIEFTISAWILPQQVGSYAAIVDFGNGAGVDNIIFGLTVGSNLRPYLAVYRSSGSISAESSQVLTNGQWQFFTATFNGTSARIYLNGTLMGSSSFSSSTLASIQRSNCYIGKSAWSGDGYSSSYLDDLRFYNKSLTQTEIVQLMTMLSQNGTCREIKYIFEFEKSLVYICFLNL